MPCQPSDLLAHDLIGGERNDEILEGFASMGFPVGRERSAFRIDDPIVVWHAVLSGMAIGFVSEHRVRTDPAVIPVLPKLRIERYPVWLVVHGEVRTSKPIRAVYGFLADALPGVI